jgi:hypothetical protein
MLLLAENYAAWLLVCITSARPGSFIVIQGYQNGRSDGGRRFPHTTRTLGLADAAMIGHRIPTHGHSEWGARDLLYRRVPFLRRAPNPHRREYVKGRRSYFLPPSNNRLPLDLGAVLKRRHLSEAFSSTLWATSGRSRRTQMVQSRRSLSLQHEWRGL